ncbi:hypothetical protein [Haliscomenobacter hydrossis]|nr:hypothetical protein [Haliscomenobacter hydrossis]
MSDKNFLDTNVLVYSGNLRHGQLIDGVLEIKNPFNLLDQK